MKTKTLSLLVGLSAALPWAATAGSRASANYSVAADTMDAGGRKSASALYANDGCAGGISGISTATIPTETAKHGYIAQLFNVTNLFVSANPTTVNEGATRQLSALAMLDDNTVTPVAGSTVAWSVLSGPINSINASGLATASYVYQNTSATVQGTFGGKLGNLGLTVLNVGTDDFPPYAGDGIDDAWQVQYFGLNNPNAAPNADPDGDGQDNRYEFIVGSIPTDPSSQFRLRIEPVPARPWMNLIFSPRLPDRTYTVQFKLDLGVAGFADLAGFTFSDAGPERTVTDLNAVEPNKFYQVRITKP